MGNITSDQNKIGFRKERNAQASYIARYTSSRRVGYGGTIGTPVAIPATKCLQWDKPDGDLDIPEPMRKKEGVNAIGEGRNTAEIKELAFETVEQAITVHAQTGIWLYYALGGVVTAGTDGVPLTTPITDASITRTGDTTCGGWDLGATDYTGKQMRVTNGKYRGTQYPIASNTDAVITITGTLPTDLATSKDGGSPILEIVELLTDTVASFTGSTVTLTDAETRTENELAGKTLIITNGTTYLNWAFTIVSHAAKSGAALVLVLNTPLPAIGTPTVKIVDAPYTHTISEPSSTANQCTPAYQVYLPTFITHIENTDGTVTKVRDMIGCIVKSLKITIEKGAETMYEVTIMVPKSMVGTTQTTYPVEVDESKTVLEYPTEDFFTWEHIDRVNSTFLYNSAPVFGSSDNWFEEAFKLEITIDNEIEINNVLGDPYPNKYMVGKRDYTILMSYYPNSNEITSSSFDGTAYRLLYALKQTKLASYAGNLAMIIRFARIANDYVQLTFNSLYVDEYPDKLIPIDTKEVAVDVTFKNAPAAGSVTAGTCAGVVKDFHNNCYYGDT